MKRLTKITFTVTAEEAATLANAINFFRIGCTKATAENHDGEKEASPENMAALEVTPEQLVRFIDFRHWILDEISDLNEWNAEVEHFENIGKKPTTPYMTADNTSTEVSPPSQGGECESLSEAGVVLNQQQQTSTQP